MPRTSERERLSRLLIVEDDPSQLRTLTNIMQKEGFEVIGASTGAEALAHLEREDFGVAVVDLRLPDLPGTQLLEKINALDPTIRIVIDTGYSSFDSAKEAVNLGAFAYVEKAGDPEELVRRVHDASRWHLERYATDLEHAVAVRTSELRRSNDALRSEITERQRAEERLRKLSVAVEQSPSMVMITDTQGEIEYVNPKFTEVTGYSAQEIFGENPRILRSGEMSREDYKTLWETITAGKEWHGEFHNKKKNGELYWESASISGVKNAEGIITHFLAVKEDITERKRVEETLRLTQFAVEHSADAVYWVRKDGQISYANEAACRSLGYSRDQLLAMSVAEIDPDFSAHAWPAHWEEMKCTGSMTFESRHRTRKGRVFPVEIATNHVEYLDQEYIWAFVRDITERKRTEEQKNLLKEQLHHSQKMEAIGQLAGGMTHNFSNLLQVISGNIEVLKGAVGDHDPAVHKTLALANEACEQAVDLARSLLTFSCRTTTEKQTIDLRSIVHSAVRLLDRTLPAAVRLVFDESGDVPVWIDGDQAQLQQVIINLAINARDAMPDGGTLTISVEEVDGSGQQELTDSPGLEDRFARLVVADTGTGMPPEVKARIFEPFFTTKPHEEGTGLGLSIVHGVVEDHGGHVEVHSEIGVGSTFTIFLPCVHPSSNEVTVEPSLNAPQGHGELILLAAGDRQVRAIVAANLKSAGYEVLQADDGPAVLECADHHGSAIQLFVLEQGLSEHTGLECLQRIRAAGLGTPAIILSDAEQEHLEEQLDNDTALLRKPFLLQELGRLVADRLAPARRAGPSLQEESVS